jgi:predicted transcriptional regulator
VTARKYRTKLRVLRDVLLASRKGSKKTRIIGLANLNRASFDSYMSFCLKSGLLEQHDGRYETTPRAEEALGIIDVVLARASELDAALQRLSSLVASNEAGDRQAPNNGDAETRQFSDRMLATWEPVSHVLLQPPESPPEGRRRE